MAASRPFQQILNEHQQRLDRVTDARAIPALRRVYDRTGAELNNRLRRLARADRSDSMTAMQAHQLRAQVKQAQVVLSRKMAGSLGDVTQDAQREALRALPRDMSRLERAYTGADIVLPIEEAARFNGVIDKRRTSLLSMHEESMARYGSRAIARFEQEIGLSLASGETPADAADRVMAIYDMEWYQAERIARTETAWAFNATYNDGLVDAATELDDLWKRWTELVDDATGEPYDDRVSVDSLAMHGQITGVDDVFTMPSTAPRADADGRRNVPEQLVGQTWDFPPNRPNDRAVVAPWRPHWGIPGWRYSDGRRLPVRARGRLASSE